MSIACTASLKHTSITKNISTTLCELNVHVFIFKNNMLLAIESIIQQTGEYSL